MDPIDWTVTDGEDAREALAAFEAMVRRSSSISVSGAVRVHQTRDGQVVVAEESVADFSGAFAVALRGIDAVTVGEGTVNLVQPMIGGVRLDGTLPTGQPSPGGVPALSLASGGDRETRRSYVCLRVRRAEGFAAGFDPGDPEALTVVHLPSLLPGGIVSQDPDVGHKPLAQIRWDEEGRIPLAVRQMVYFDQRYEFVSGGEGRPGRHEFGPEM